MRVLIRILDNYCGIFLLLKMLRLVFACDKFDEHLLFVVQTYVVTA